MNLSVQKRTVFGTGIVALLILLGVRSAAKKQLAPATAEETKRPAEKPLAKPAEPPEQTAWRILREGAKDENTERRTKAVRALGLRTGNSEAEKRPVQRRQDGKPKVRGAAGAARG